MTSEELFEKAGTLPLTPGVYLMKNRSGRVIYVGKSKALKNRVSSYFAPYSHHYGKTTRMVASVYDFEVYHTATELEALLLENSFIKQYKPHYNIKLKDTSKYPYIRISSGEYPEMSVTYSRKSDNDRYFGPFSSTSVAYSIIDTAKKTFGLPTCHREFPRDSGKGRPCLSYHIGRCCAPCIAGNITQKQYAELYNRADILLKGNYSFLIKQMTEDMQKASESEQFELAAKYRDCISAVKKLGDKQQIVASPDINADVIGVFADDLGSAVTILFVRAGAVVDKESFFFGVDEIMNSAALEALLMRFYELRGYVPKKVCISEKLEPDERELLQSFLSRESGLAVCVSTPVRGLYKALAERACENAQRLLLQKRAEDEKHGDFLLSLAKFLCLPAVPERIESYDISHTGGEFPCCGMIVLENGRFAKKKYRSFSITTVKNDDCASLTEALDRRFSHDNEENGWEYPDLILVDGGITQTNAVKAVLEEKTLSIPVFGMVKDEHHKTRTLTDGENEISLNSRQDVFVFIYKIQEEVHRFSLAKMDSQRRKTVSSSSLTQIKGVGKAKADALMKHFITLSALKAADINELTQVAGINETVALAIRRHFEKENEE